MTGFLLAWPLPLDADVLGRTLAEGSRRTATQTPERGRRRMPEGRTQMMAACAEAIGEGRADKT
jgi:hypothetical protein